MFANAVDERRRGPLERFEKLVLAGFGSGGLAQVVLGCERAHVLGQSFAGAMLAAAGMLVCALLWFLRERKAPVGAIAVPVGLLVGTAGIYSGYTATSVPFSSLLQRFAVPLLLVLFAAVLLFADQEWPFQRVVLGLTAIAFVVAEMTLTLEAHGARLFGTANAARSVSSIAPMQPREVTRAFIDAINAHDAAAIVALTTSDHRFIDSLGDTLAGGSLLDAWKSYFRMVPDYRVVATQWLTDGDVVVAIGTASGTYTSDGTLRKENAWSTPAAWRAVIRDGKVAEWQVYADNEPIRAVMKRSGGS